MSAIRDGRTPKCSVFETARLAGILAAKRISEPIPLCHSLNFSLASVDMKVLDEEIRIRTKVRRPSANALSRPQSEVGPF